MLNQFNRGTDLGISMKFFPPPNFFKLHVAILLPIFGNVDGSWRATSKLRGSTLIQVARRRSKDDPCKVKNITYGDILGGGLKKFGKIH